MLNDCSEGLYSSLKKSTLSWKYCMYVCVFLKIIYNSAAKPIATLDKHITTVVMQ